MYSQETLKSKTKQELRKFCKDIGCAQYGDKATLVSRILDSDALETIAPPEDTSLDVADKDYGKMKKEELIFLLKKKKIGGFSGKKKAELIKKLERYDAEMDRIEKEKNILKEDFGECEQCIDLPNIKARVKAHFKCNDCDLKICGPCEIAHIKTKVTRHHMIEPLLQINLIRQAVPEFAKPSTGGTVPAPTACSQPTSWVDNLVDDGTTDNDGEVGACGLVEEMLYLQG